MTSEKTPNPAEEERDRKFYLIAGIYRVVKNIDDRVDRILDELGRDDDSDSLNYFTDPYWHENGNDHFY